MGKKRTVKPKRWVVDIGVEVGVVRCATHNMCDRS